MVTFISAAGRRDIGKKAKDLYLEAFPPEERVPWFLLKWKTWSDKAKVFGIRDGAEFVGMVYEVYYRDIVFVFYVAIVPELRGKGYGSQVFDGIKERHPGKRLILNIETVDETSPNYEERARRKRFYLKNGFQDVHLKTLEKDVVYEMLCFGGTVDYKEYAALVQDYMGKRMFEKYYQEVTDAVSG